MFGIATVGAGYLCILPSLVAMWALRDHSLIWALPPLANIGVFGLGYWWQAGELGD
jgi:hypothetical protein